MAVSKLELKDRPTNKDLQNLQVELHDCLNVNSIHVQMLAAAMGVKLPTPDEVLKGYIPGRARRRVGGLPPLLDMARIAGAVVGALGLYRLLEPPVIAFAQSLHQGLMNFRPW